ncbi:MAG: AbrB/MazE/SpoVT family DNA-binding domain-containing protein [Nitriliruptoraceae bacterium]|nr:AbrB/MazE/SpoVT family DNA-binding domain-containing protein [Nitriliruptoraceae bacterium]
MRTKIDGAGRVVIPAAIRRAFGIGPQGGELDLVDTPDGVLLRPVDHAAVARKERGLTVASLGRPVEQSEVAEAIRSDREDGNG